MSDAMTVVKESEGNEMFCAGSSAAKRQYLRDVRWWMVAYVVVIVGSVLMVKHTTPVGWQLYFWSGLPSLPVIGVIWRMGKYLREETDEYLRWMTMQSILVGTGVLLAVLLVSDFLRAYAHTGALPPFAAYLIFAGGMAATQAWQWLQNRASDDEPA